MVSNGAAFWFPCPAPRRFQHPAEFVGHVHALDAELADISRDAAGAAIAGELRPGARRNAARPGRLSPKKRRRGKLKLRKKVKQAGAIWRPQQKLWELRYDQARALGLTARIVSG